jgi:hypothetical protein
MDFRNKQLHEAVKAYVLAAFRLVSQTARPAVAPSASDMGETPIQVSSAELSALPEYRRCVEVLSADPVVSGHLNRFVGTSIMGGGHLSASELLERIFGPGEYPRHMVFDEKWFGSLYATLERAFDDDSFSCEAIAPLQGLAINAPVVKFSDDLEISQLTPEEERQVHVIEVVRRYGPRWTDRHYAVRAKYRLPKVVVQDQSEISDREKAAAEEKQAEVNERIEEVIHTLRVFRQGTLNYGGVVHRADNWPFGGAMNISGKSLESTYGIYPLDSDADIDELKGFWNEVQSAKAKGHKFLAVAMRRFSYGCERHRVEDKVIDLMISAEAFSQASTSGKKGKPVADYVSSSAPAGEKNKVRRHIRKSYRLRNAIMHEGDVAGWLTEHSMGVGDLYTFLGMTEHYLRAALRGTIRKHT